VWRSSGTGTTSTSLDASVAIIIIIIIIIIIVVVVVVVVVVFIRFPRFVVMVFITIVAVSHETIFSAALSRGGVTIVIVRQQKLRGLVGRSVLPQARATAQGPNAPVFATDTRQITPE
jgi:carbon starvation protein CstA